MEHIGVSTTREASRPRARRRSRLAGLTAGLLAAASLGTVPSPADASVVTYVGTTTGTQSSIAIHAGDQYERTLHPTGSLTATLDTLSDSVVSSSVEMDESTTETFVGPFNLLVYVKTELEQVGDVTGSATPSATPGVMDLTADVTNRLRVTVYRQVGATQNPATDGKLTDPAKCWVDLSLSLTGQADQRTGALSLGSPAFTIPTFPNGSVDPNHTCGFATGSLNTQVAGPNNSISLNFSGGPTNAHFTGLIDSAASAIIIKKGDWLLQRVVRPEGTMTSDIDFTTNTASNTTTGFAPITMKALPNPLSALPLSATVALTPQGTPGVTIAPSGKPGIDTITAAVKARMHVTLFVTGFPGWKITDGAKCYVDVNLNLTGTVDRGTFVLTLGTPAFTVPKFPSGCGLLGKTALDTALSGAKNSVYLVIRDGVA
jgi:hypothetical protein